MLIMPEIFDSNSLEPAAPTSSGDVNPADSTSSQEQEQRDHTDDNNDDNIDDILKSIMSQSNDLTEEEKLNMAINTTNFNSAKGLLTAGLLNNGGSSSFSSSVPSGATSGTTSTSDPRSKKISGGHSGLFGFNLDIAINSPSATCGGSNSPNITINNAINTTFNANTVGNNSNNNQLQSMAAAQPQARNQLPPLPVSLPSFSLPSNVLSSFKCQPPPLPQPPQQQQPQEQQGQVQPVAVPPPPQQQQQQKQQQVSIGVNNIMPPSNYQQYESTANCQQYEHERDTNGFSKTFPQKLMDVLSRPDTGDSIVWMPDGTSFIIINSQLLVRDILPRFFKSSKFSSFTRKLNRWGFKRITSGPNAGAYYHPNFTRGDYKTCLQMRCYKATPGTTTMPPPTTTPSSPATSSVNSTASNSSIGSNRKRTKASNGKKNTMFKPPGATNGMINNLQQQPPCTINNMMPLRQQQPQQNPMAVQQQMPMQVSHQQQQMMPMTPQQQAVAVQQNQQMMQMLLNMMGQLQQQQQQQQQQQVNTGTMAPQQFNFNSSS